MTEVLAIAALPHHQSNQKSCMSMSQLLDPWRTLQATQGKANFAELFQIKSKKRKYKTDDREKRRLSFDPLELCAKTMKLKIELKCFRL